MNDNDQVENFLTENLDLTAFLSIMHNVFGSQFKDMLTSNDLRDELFDLGYLTKKDLY
jgi:hypothetical protein